MGKSLRVKVSGQFATVESPYIMHEGGWKTVHKVWVMSGGTWKESHITPYTKYNSGSGGQSTTTTSGTWTVPANTRWIRVTILGNGGGGGAANRTNVYHDKTASANSGNPPWSSSQTSSDGGNGGAGGKAEVVMEVEPGTVFTYTNLGSPGDGGTQDDALPNQNQTQGGTGRGNLYLRRNNYDSDRSVTPPPAATFNPSSLTPTSTSTLQIGNDGIAGSTIQFTGASPLSSSGGSYNITVNGGGSGAGGRLFVSSWTVHTSGFGEKQAKYTLSSGAGANGANGDQSSSGGNRTVTNMTTGGGGAGGSGATGSLTSAPGGSTGTGGSITIETYQGI